MTQGNFEQGFAYLQQVLTQPAVLNHIGVDRAVIDGMFDIIHGLLCSLTAARLARIGVCSHGVGLLCV